MPPEEHCSTANVEDKADSGEDPDEDPDVSQKTSVRLTCTPNQPDSSLIKQISIPFTPQRSLNAERRTSITQIIEELTRDHDLPEAPLADMEIHNTEVPIDEDVPMCRPSHRPADPWRSIQLL